MQRPNTIYYWSSPLLESSCTPATPSLPAILGKIAFNQLKMIDKVTFYNSNNALEPTSLVICNGIVELVQVLRKLEKPKYSFKTTLYFCIFDERWTCNCSSSPTWSTSAWTKSTRRQNQEDRLEHFYIAILERCLKEHGNFALLVIVICDPPSLDCNLPHFVQPRSLDHVQLRNTKSRSHPGSGQFIFTKTQTRIRIPAPLKIKLKP